MIGENNLESSQVQLIVSFDRDFFIVSDWKSTRKDSWSGIHFENRKMQRNPGNVARILCEMIVVLRFTLSEHTNGMAFSHDLISCNQLETARDHDTRC